MSLISPRNLLAPLQNKVHLFTIFLVGVVFLVLRYSGGSVDVRDRKAAPHSRELNAEAAETTPREPVDPAKLFDPRAEARRLGLETTEEGSELPPTTIQVRPRDNSKDLPKENRRIAPPARDNSPAAAPKKGGNALDEIEQSLGLR